MALQPLFEFEQVSVVAGATRILDAITARVPSSGITAVVGPSGAGKSTLLRLCNRLAVPSSGTVRFQGTEIGRLDPLALRRTVGMVFQRPTVFGGTVRENLEVAAPGLEDDAYEAALAASALDPALLDRPAQDLSGGEAQRMCLTRSLMAKPAVLLMDEPTSSVDSSARDAIEEQVSGLSARGVPIVLVTHDLAQMRRMCDRAIVLIAGRVRAVAEGTQLDSIEDPEARSFIAGTQ